MPLLLVSTFNIALWLIAAGEFAIHRGHPIQ